MSLSLCMLSACLQEILSDILATHEQLHTGSIEFTVLRENKQPIGFEVFVRCLLAEQKTDVSPAQSKKDVKIPSKDYV